MANQLIREKQVNEENAYVLVYIKRNKITEIFNYKELSELLSNDKKIPVNDNKNNLVNNNFLSQNIKYQKILKNYRIFKNRKKINKSDDKNINKQNKSIIEVLNNNKELKSNRTFENPKINKINNTFFDYKKNIIIKNKSELNNNNGDINLDKLLNTKKLIKNIKKSRDIEFNKENDLFDENAIFDNKKEKFYYNKSLYEPKIKKDILTNINIPKKFNKIMYL